MKDVSTTIEPKSKKEIRIGVPVPGEELLAYIDGKLIVHHDHRSITGSGNKNIAIKIGTKAEIDKAISDNIGTMEDFKTDLG